MVEHQASPEEMLRSFPSKMKLGICHYIQGNIKNITKRGGHHGCFHATILTNMAILVISVHNK